ncbi:MAG: lysyl oxidase family protein [Flavobacteriales bacterium]|jgi:hypothetical protein|nr:lysyl oxidase family protein [Flavobacteriales bacterium]
MVLSTPARTGLKPLLVLACALWPAFHGAQAQCTLTQAAGCVCQQAGQTHCDLLPDMTISWYGLESYLNGPSEQAQGATGSARLRISGSTPNIGHGPLEVRTADQSGVRRFVCGTDTFSMAGQMNFNCPNGENPRQIIFQQVYRKEGGTMLRNERMAGSMTYHSSHNHYHVNDWTTMSLCLEDPDEPDPRKWPVVATGAKVGFCLMDYGSCTYYNGHCRDVQLYGQGQVLTTSMFPNQGLHGSYGCGNNIQGISVGRTDIYSENLDMMWINLMDGLCDGNYWIVAEVDPTNVFQEENDDNNWTMIPFSLAQQRPAGSGGTAGIQAPDGTRIAPGGSVRLVATPGHAYAWSTGATTRTIEVGTPGTYAVTVTAPCGTLTSSPVEITAMPGLAPPIGVGDQVVGPATAELSATGDGEQVLWYAAPEGGEPLAAGNTFNTPVLEQTTAFYASTRTVHAGQTASGGKTNASGSQNSSDADQSLIFDAYEPFELVSVKVYATGNGDRHFVLVDNVGNLIAERYVYVPAGMHRVDLNIQVPAGTAHRITAFDDNTEIVQHLHRDASGVSYPYAIGAMGAITGSTAGPGYYYYLYDWEVRTPAVTVESPRTEVVAEVSAGVQLAVKALLDGPFDPGTALMGDGLRLAGLVPATEPYTALGYVHAGGGGEQMDPALLSITGPSAVVDWVVVELRSAGSPATVVASTSGLLRRDGSITGAQGGVLTFMVPAGEYHVAVRHRNHLGAMTATPVTLSGALQTIDLAAAATATWGTDARCVNGSHRTLWSGNAGWDDRIKYTGATNDRDLVLDAVGGTVPTAAVPGYLGADITMDGIVRYTGGGNDRDPILSTIGGSVPTAVRFEQLP